MHSEPSVEGIRIELDDEGFEVITLETVVTEIPRPERVRRVVGTGCLYIQAGQLWPELKHIGVNVKVCRDRERPGGEWLPSVSAKAPKLEIILGDLRLCSSLIAPELTRVSGDFAITGGPSPGQKPSALERLVMVEGDFEDRLKNPLPALVVIRGSIYHGTPETLPALRYVGKHIIDQRFDGTGDRIIRNFGPENAQEIGVSLLVKHDLRRKALSSLAIEEADEHVDEFYEERGLSL